MGFNIKNNYGPNIEVNDGGVVHLHQDRSGHWTTDIEDAQIVEDIAAEEVTPGNSHERNKESEEGENVSTLNFFAPQKNLQELLKHSWFADVRTDAKYDAAWTDNFIEALIASEYGEGIARDWAVEGMRNKHNQIKAYVVGLLKDANVLKGSYDAISVKVALTDKPRTFSRAMAEGKKQRYAEWVKEYVAE